MKTIAKSFSFGTEENHKKYIDDMIEKTKSTLFAFQEFKDDTMLSQLYHEKLTSEIKDIQFEFTLYRVLWGKNFE